MTAAEGATGTKEEVLEVRPGHVGVVTAAEGATGTDDRTVVFLSDLHLASDPEKRDFFAQDELVALLDELLARPEPVDLVITGDFFDLLQLTGHDRATLFRLALDRPEYSALLDRLRRFNAAPRHQTIYLIGNHDAEIGWNQALQRYLLESGLVNQIALAYAYTYLDGAGNGCFVYAEHGNEYDGVNTVGDYQDPAVTPLGAHIVTDLVNYLEPLGRHASLDAPTSIADIDNIHPLGVIPWWFLSTYFYQQIRRVVKYIIIPASILYLVFHLLPIYFLLERYKESPFARGIRSLPDLEAVLTLLVIAFDSSAILIALVWLLIRYDFARTRRRYGLQDPDDIFRRGARHYRRTCEALVGGALRPAHWPAGTPWQGTELFVYGHTHEQDLVLASAGGSPRAYANTGTWTRKVIRIRTNLKLPPVFVPTYQLTYLIVTREAAAIRATLWEWPKALDYRLPWTERLATLGRARPPRQPKCLAPRRLNEVVLPFRPAPTIAPSGAPHLVSVEPATPSTTR